MRNVRVDGRVPACDRARVVVIAPKVTAAQLRDEKIVAEAGPWTYDGVCLVNKHSRGLWIERTDEAASRALVRIANRISKGRGRR